jgi:hypothetical protein
MMLRRAVGGKVRVEPSPERFACSTCGCRKLVRIADLRFCPSGGHVMRGFRNCAIHPNPPRFTRSVPRLDMSDDGVRDRAVSRYSRQ